MSPATYTVTIDADGARAQRTIVVKADPMLPLTVAQHRAREAFLLDVAALQRAVADRLAKPDAPRPQLARIRQGGMEDSDVGGQGVQDSVSSLQPVERDPGVVVKPLGDGMVVRVVARAERRPERVDVLVPVPSDIRLDADELWRSDAIPDELHRREDPRGATVAVVERMDRDQIEMEQCRPN